MHKLSGAQEPDREAALPGKSDAVNLGASFQPAVLPTEDTEYPVG